MSAPGQMMRERKTPSRPSPGPHRPLPCLFFPKLTANRADPDVGLGERYKRHPEKLEPSSARSSTDRGCELAVALSDSKKIESLRGLSRPASVKRKRKMVRAGGY
jgi:hypothetical protein